MENSGRIIVGMGSCGIAAGAKAVYQQLEKADLGIPLGLTSCVGMCFAEPIVEVESLSGRIMYGNVDAAFADKLIESLKTGTENLPAENRIKESSDGKKYLDRQVKIALKNCGVIDPENIDEYIAAGGYDAIKKCIESMKPDEVIETVKESGLRGRGGAGFTTGIKWSFLAGAKGDPKYLVCNADEGDPGAFMDRAVLEGDPHSVIEGMLVAAYSTGASLGYVYCRAEYPLAIKRLIKAIADAEERNLMGDNILGTEFSFHLKVKEGAGAFVCGEETALMASIEGRRGMPALRPPFPAEAGIKGKPTNINNVETYANVPFIIREGPSSFNKYSYGSSVGTKVFALAGKIKRVGLVEVPMGISIREIIEEIGGGSATGNPIKAVQLGGPAGGCIPESLFDTPIDYDSINATGAIMGSGGMVVMDDQTCMVDVARYFLNFTQKESCGKCTFCRIGTKRMLEILTRITDGKGVENDISLLEELAGHIKKTSLCGLGQLAPNPVLTTLKYFRDEYEAHIVDKKCPAGVCKPLITFTVNPENCVGCTACAKACPTKCISGERKEVHFIDPEKCVKCGICRDTCKFDAIDVE
ncbi:MAG: NADH-quinone oxidoreductase subunit NuoF [Spirochaetales bacterium]|nr:NADH-quinone oxidoreductase subunit NuoF [Spirochaetales bacterium]